MWIALAFSWYLAILFLSGEAKAAQEGNLVVAYCKGTVDGEWRNNLRETFSMTKVGMTELFCSDVRPTDFVLATIIGSEYEQVVKPQEEHIDTYLAKILRKMSDSKISVVGTSSELEGLLKNNQESFVAFIRSQDSLEHRVFQQVALSVEIPHTLQVIATHNSDIFSSEIQLNISKNMEVWFVKDKKWVALEYPDISDDVLPEEVHHKLITYVRHLNYPLIFTYNGDDFDDTYEGSKLNYLLAFHTSSQQAEVMETLIEPLSREFQLYFAFILIDCDKFPDIMEERFKIKTKSLPQLMSLKNGQKRGVHIDSDKVPYSVNDLIEVLKLVLRENPKILAVDPDYVNNATNTSIESPAWNESQKEDHQHTEL